MQCVIYVRIYAIVQCILYMCIILSAHRPSVASLVDLSLRFPSEMFRINPLRLNIWPQKFISLFCNKFMRFFLVHLFSKFSTLCFPPCLTCIYHPSAHSHLHCLQPGFLPLPQSLDFNNAPHTKAFSKAFLASKPILLFANRFFLFRKTYFASANLLYTSVLQLFLSYSQVAELFIFSVSRLSNSPHDLYLQPST